VINRSAPQDTPFIPVAPYYVTFMFGTRVAGTILVAVHVRARHQAGHMDACDPTKALHHPCKMGAVHIWDTKLPSAAVLAARPCPS